MCGLDWCDGTFMMRSDLNVPTPAMPMPDFAVPYAAPKPVHNASVIHLTG